MNIRNIRSTKSRASVWKFQPNDESSTFETAFTMENNESDDGSMNASGLNERPKSKRKCDLEECSGCSIDYSRLSDECMTPLNHIE